MEKIIKTKTFNTGLNNYRVELIQDEEKPMNEFKLRVYRVIGRWIKREKYAGQEEFDFDEIDFLSAAQDFVLKIDRRYRELKKWSRSDGCVSPPAGEEWILEEPEPILVNDWQSGQQYEIYPDWERKWGHGDQPFPAEDDAVEDDNDV